jgi:hypothetical protein
MSEHYKKWIAKLKSKDYWLDKYIDNRVACKYLGQAHVSLFNMTDLLTVPFTLGRSRERFLVPKGFYRNEYPVTDEMLMRYKEEFEVIWKNEYSPKYIDDLLVDDN